MTDAREVIARALCCPDGKCRIPHDCDAPFIKTRADAIVAALAEAGLVVVPRERTEEMHHAAQRTTGAIITRAHSAEIWNGMVRAALAAAEGSRDG